VPVENQVKATYQVTAKVLRLAAAFASKDETRPALCGVELNDDTVGASDGHVAVRIGVSLQGSPDAPSIIVPSDSIKAISTKAEDVSVVVNGDYRLVAQRTETIFQPIDNQFPNLDAAMPKGEPVVTIALNPALAAEAFAALAKYLGAKRGDIWGPERVLVSIYSDVQPIKLTCGPGDSITALIMPVRR
jgi:DNA polymerase III sliding clamp (beta) subunit (PCNA family)